MELQDQVTALQAEVATLKTEIANIKTQLASKEIDWEEREFQINLAVIQGKMADGMISNPNDVAEIAKIATKEILKSIKTQEV